MTDIIPLEKIQSKIYLIRDQKVMVDKDLAELYEVETWHLKRQVRRNIDRFPDDFMFELTNDEFENLKDHSLTLGRGGTRYNPYVFTVHGVSMLSSILKSEKAIQINIQIMRAFVNYMITFSNYDELKKALYALELKQNADIEQLYKLLFHEVDRLECMIKPDDTKKIGF